MGELHRAEIARLAGRTGIELGFRALTYQNPVRKLHGAMAPDYGEYLERRYGLGAQQLHTLDA